MNCDGLTYAQRMALSPMPKKRPGRRKVSRLRERFEKVDRELHELGCACVGFDERQLLQRDVLQRLLFEREGTA